MTANIYDDLLDECADVDALVTALTEAQWAQATPAPGWTIAHQIAHLAWTDQQAALAATDPDGFHQMLAEITDPLGLVDAGADPAGYPEGPLTAWRRSREEVVAALRKIEPGNRVPWFGPPMAAPSMATARLMETWAHGQDIADTLGITRTPTDRLRHVAHIAVRARDYAYLVNGLTAPTVPIFVGLTSPTGDQWTWGPSTAAHRITGPALDFCLLAVQRRHRDDTTLTATGEEADQWLTIIQAFAGPPGTKRTPNTHPATTPSTH
ncbi:TIGR03084 family metal-binding protein [Actinocorallia lasiicapitis]